ncbi:bifunctional phosphopantothenoylcysteine decarboxylase/phosphopantothenate--cysteine ligase CoaBC [Chryseomicrobium excrementi]|uniref:Coenzyme A biosynthesis bifunctional protein CoaBC n=1 Tax=Chryseomicrobium excrementi TaxID=2041346 RepID=A0A2M9F391_9BACL|nr:bifunctional phosphopantothenoylcysteine decarboxylase/phosphopantothenate--cysteine ligase CoaBC [Chryseomicrobium excrementi]PJK17919.1 bifunctional phosphopantothenoylcysteine decarboxylase/phosphopantothenate--cysteine ligase CoaBC [Chryseomicrobium excrementi]
MTGSTKILLCVTGGIAVYKAVALVSKLTQAGADVRVIMSQSAMEFVQPLSFQAMSRNDVYFDTFDEKDSRVIAHIDLADWPDLVVVAPATANVIGKYANGIADDMITTTLLATTKEVWMAPAMNVHMYDHPAVQQNIDTLYKRGVRFIEPSEGYLACGYVGKGRLEEPEKITELILNRTNKSKPLIGKQVVVTAGPTRERIDPVRYVSNFSSGKMGFAMAKAAAELGANVTLVAGPVGLATPPGVTRIDVESAAEMLEAVEKRFSTTDLLIKTAAVADYKPKHPADQKVKKQQGDTSLEMERTTDILATMGAAKTHQIIIGFAAETNDVEAYADAKRQKKNADYIIANDVTQPGVGFGTDTNKVVMFSSEGKVDFPMLAKDQLATELLQHIVKQEGWHS